MDSFVSTFLLFLKNRIPLKKNIRMIPTKRITMKGNNKVRMDITTAEIPSNIDTNTFPMPPVITVLVPRINKVVSWEMDAMPPPPMIETLQVKKGSNSPIKDAVKIEPAMTATGVAIVFMTLSTNGI